MLSKTLSSRWLVFAALGVVSLASIAPAAQAGHGRGNGKKWKSYESYGRGRGGYSGTRYVVRDRVVYSPSRVVYRNRSSSLGPALAGFVGGLVLGAVISNGTAHAQVSAGNYYYDPYCEERFSSLDACRSHYLENGYDHPRVVELIDGRSGRCSGQFAYDRGHWRTYQREEHRYVTERYRDDGYNDDRYRDDRNQDQGYDRGYDYQR